MFKDYYIDKYCEFLDDGLSEDEASKKASEATENYIADYGDYLYNQMKDKSL